MSKRPLSSAVPQRSTLRPSMSTLHHAVDEEAFDEEPALKEVHIGGSMLVLVYDDAAPSSVQSPIAAAGTSAAAADSSASPTTRSP